MIELRDLPWWKGRRLISTEEQLAFVRLFWDQSISLADFLAVCEKYRAIENSPGGLRTVYQTDFIEIDEKDA